MPEISNELLHAVEVMKRFLLQRGYIDRDFALHDWVDPRPLRARSRSKRWPDL